MKPLSFFKTMLAGALGTILASIVAGFLFVLLLVGLINSISAKEEIVIQEKSILVLDLSGNIVEKGTSPFELPAGIPFLSGSNNIGLYEIREAVKTAKDDEKILGIYFKPGNFASGWASLRALRKDLVDFASSGKFIIAFGESFTEKSWYLASTADQIYLYPEGGLELNGIASNPMFFKGLFDKAGIQPKVFRVGSYKSAVEPFTRENMSDENRQQIKEILDGIWTTFIDEAAASRGITSGVLSALADSIVIESPEDAVKYKLVDGLKTEGDVLKLLMEKSEVEKIKDLKLINIKKYAEAMPGSEGDTDRENQLAVIFAEGAIVDGKGGADEIGSADLTEIIRKVREEEKIKAVVLRVNSPGGSALASDVILSELEKLKAEKPLVISMGDLAASGGYYISCKGDKIFAEPNTITGSIGVFGLLFNAELLFREKLGITFDRVHTNPYADIGNPYRDMSEFEAKKIQNSVDRIYSRFLTIVADGRENLPDTSAVHKIAQGRVWTGSMAKEIGLVDEIGGLDAAIAEAVSRGGLPEDYRITTFPKEEDPYTELMKAFGLAAVAGPEFSEEIEMYRKVKKSLPRSGIYATLPFDLNIE